MNDKILMEVLIKNSKQKANGKISRCHFCFAASSVFYGSFFGG